MLKRKPIGKRNGINIYTTLKAKKINQMSSGKYKRVKAEQELKKELIDQCGGLCQCCGQPGDWRGLSKHERVFRSKGGNPLDKDNVEILCFKCHAARHHIVEK